MYIYTLLLSEALLLNHETNPLNCANEFLSCLPFHPPHHEDAVAGKLAEVGGAELPQLGRDGVLLDEGLLRVMELEGEVAGQRDGQSPPEEVREWGGGPLGGSPMASSLLPPIDAKK